MKQYVAIDLKSFYASVECQERGLDPLKANLVVADRSRTEKTICLAVTPALKAYGIPGRARLFEVIQAVKEVNGRRRAAIHGRPFTGKSTDADELAANPYLELDFIAAPPQMAVYVQRSTQIYEIYLKYISAEDIHVYSIDEVFMDVTSYLKTYQMTAHELAIRMIRDVLHQTGITATAGIGTNLYLAKIAMDIVAKHMPADKDGVRIAELDEKSYRLQLWDHRPMTDFWRIGRGTVRKLEANGMSTLGDVARCSIGSPSEFLNEDLLYKLFGINAEFLIDHAWGYDETEIADIKSFKPENNSVSTGQVLHCPYDHEKAALIVREMTDLLVLDLVDKKLVTDQMVLVIGYDISNLENPEIRNLYHGPIVRDFYGRLAPKHANGSVNLSGMTSSTREITDAVMALYERITDPHLLIRRVNVVASHVLNEDKARAMEEEANTYRQLSLFEDDDAQQKRRKEELAAREKERRLQEAALAIQKRYGKNALLKGMNLEEGAQTIARNGQIGGHKA